MTSYRQILYHIIFRTKSNKKTLGLQYNRELFMYIHGIIKNKKCTLYRINGMEDHIHILTDLHPGLALSDYIKDIKVATSIWLKKNGNFSDFSGWAEGYAALTYSYGDKNMIVNYIKNQQEHHQKISMKEELLTLLKEQGITPNPNYFLL